MAPVCFAFSLLRRSKLTDGYLGCRYLLKHFSSVESEQLENGKPAVQKYGQPTYNTHPYLMRFGQITPGISREEYKTRRSKLMDAIQRYSLKCNHGYDNHIVILPSATKQYMTGEIPYPFRQDTDFLYFSGFQEPDSVLILHSRPQKNLPSHSSHIFLRPKDPSRELWEGPCAGVEGAPGLLKLEAAHNVSELEQFLESFTKTFKSFAVWFDYLTPHTRFNDSINQTVQKFIKNNNSKCKIESPSFLMHQIRLFKSHSEVVLMKKSCEIASKAIEETMMGSYPCVNEHELYALVDYRCRVGGAERLAYPPVVAGGERANIIHYITNNQIVEERDLVLMDAGCEYHGYSSDITRTWPVSGRFTTDQRDLYEALLQVQLDLIELAKRHISLDSLHDHMLKLLGLKLQELGIIDSKVTQDGLKQAAFKFCPHHLGHYLGMDIHDTHLIPRNIPLQEGMIITVEPGVYIQSDDLSVPACYRGLGMRIEDDVLITSKGVEVLTASCPKTVQDIENAMLKPEIL